MAVWRLDQYRYRSNAESCCFATGAARSGPKRITFGRRQPTQSTYASAWNAMTKEDLDLWGRRHGLAPRAADLRPRSGFGDESSHTSTSACQLRAACRRRDDVGCKPLRILLVAEADVAGS